MVILWWLLVSTPSESTHRDIHYPEAAGPEYGLSSKDFGEEKLYVFEKKSYIGCCAIRMILVQ